MTKDFTSVVVTATLAYEEDQNKINYSIYRGTHTALNHNLIITLWWSETEELTKEELQGRRGHVIYEIFNLERFGWGFFNIFIVLHVQRQTHNELIY